MDVVTEIEIQRKGHTEATLNPTGDPADIGWTQSLLRTWLEQNGWARSRWGEFEAVARRKGEYKVRSRVGA